MKKCKNCGTELKDIAKFCDSCGLSQETTEPQSPSDTSGEALGLLKTIAENTKKPEAPPEPPEQPEQPEEPEPIPEPKPRGVLDLFTTGEE